MDFLTDLFNHYGYIVLLMALMLELIALPVPGETLMTYCGFLVFQGKLNWGISIITAAGGVISGITISYLIGRTLGTPFFQKYGSYIHIGPDKLDKTSRWFEKYGHRLLIVTYFIPGVRHITGYFSGIARIPYKKFALTAYSGAFIWTGTFISLGRLLGSNWEQFHGSIKKYLIMGGIILSVIWLGIYFYRKYKSSIIDFIVGSLVKGIKIFHSLGKIKLAIVGLAAVFIGLSMAGIGLIQDFSAKELSQFDTVVTYLVNLIFPENWSSIVVFFKIPTSFKIMMIIIFLIWVWIIFKGRNRLLETGFLFITACGGALWEEGLQFIFHRLGPSGNVSTFPSQETFSALVIYGFAAFIILRHANNRWLGMLMLFITLGICAGTGLNIIFF